MLVKKAAAGGGCPLRPNHAAANGVPKGRKMVKSNKAVQNVSTSLNRTADTLSEVESERGSLKYVSVNGENR